MRKTVIVIAALAALSTPALAENPNLTAAEVGTGAVVGTVVGVGSANAWWGGTAASLGATTGGAIAVGGLAGIGTVVAFDAITERCAGFQALLGMNKDACVNGEYVGSDYVGRHPGHARYVR